MQRRQFLRNSLIISGSSSIGLLSAAIQSTDVLGDAKAVPCKYQTIFSMLDLGFVLVSRNHLGIVLSFNPETMEAPIIEAKSASIDTLKCVKSAIENGITVIENKYLTETLSAEFEVGDVITCQYYQAIARLLAFVHMNKDIAHKRRNDQEGRDEFCDYLSDNLLEIRVGSSLISLVDPAQGADLMDRIKRLREDIVMESGFCLPRVRVRDTHVLEPNQYRFWMAGTGGEIVGTGLLYPLQYLALCEEKHLQELEGIKVKEPAFGTPAIWIHEEMKLRAEKIGCTVVEPLAVLMTHLSVIVRKYIT